MPSISATSFCVYSFPPPSPNRIRIISLSRSVRASTVRKSRLFSSSASMPRFTVSGSLPRISDKSSSFPSQSTFSGSSSEISFLILFVLRRNMSISFSMHREAYVASFMFFDGLNVLTAFINPIVPIDIRSSIPTPEFSNFLAI